MFGRHRKFSRIAVSLAGAVLASTLCTVPALADESVAAVDEAAAATTAEEVATTMEDAGSIPVVESVPSEVDSSDATSTSTELSDEVDDSVLVEPLTSQVEQQDEQDAPAMSEQEEDLTLTAAASGGGLDGVDISGWDDVTNYSVLGDFVIIKATEYNPSKKNYTSYNDYVDKAEKALAAGKLIGFYHFATSTSYSGQTWEQQAQGFIDAVTPYLGNCLLFLDWENSSYSTVESDVAGAKAWLDYVYAKTGVMPIIYMNKNCTNSYNWSSVVNAGYELWGAQYLNKYYYNYSSYKNSSTGFVDDPELTSGWGAWGKPLIYQYTSTGTLRDGNEYDVNKFYGTKQDWLARCGVREMESTEAEAAAFLADGAIYRFATINATTTYAITVSDENACVGSASYRESYWVVENLGSGLYRFKNYQTGAMLSFTPEVYNGTNVGTGGTVDTWRLVKCSNGAFALKPYGYESFRLDVSGGKTTTKGANLQLYKANNSASQRFFLIKATGLMEAASAGKPVEDGTYVITSALSDAVAIDIKSGSTANAANVQIYKNNGTLAQRYTLSYQGNGLYKIINLKSGRVLDVEGGKTTKGANVQQYNFNNTLAQLWYLKKSGSSYIICSALSGLVLDIAGGKTSNGTNVQIYASNGTNAQKFNLTEDVMLEQAMATGKTFEEGVYTIYTVVTPGKVVDVKGGSVESKANIQLYSSNYSMAQKYQLEYMGNGLYVIRSAKSGKVLEVAGGSTTSGANVQQYAYNGTRAQMWYIKQIGDSYQIFSARSGLALSLENEGAANGTNICVMTASDAGVQRFQLQEVPLLDNGTYTIKSSLGNYRLSVKDASTAKGANVQVWSTSSNEAQRWEVTHLGDGVYKIVNKHSGLALEVAGASTSAGANVQQYADNGTAAQQWTIKVTSTGAMVFQNVASGLVLEVASSKPDNGTNVRQGTASGGTTQSFTVTKESAASSSVFLDA